MLIGVFCYILLYSEKSVKLLLFLGVVVQVNAL